MMGKDEETSSYSRYAAQRPRWSGAAAELTWLLVVLGVCGEAETGWQGGALPQGRLGVSLSRRREEQHPLGQSPLLMVARKTSDS